MKQKYVTLTTAFIWVDISGIKPLIKLAVTCGEAYNITLLDGYTCLWSGMLSISVVEFDLGDAL